MTPRRHESDQPRLSGKEISRRSLLKSGAALGAVAGIAATSRSARLIDTALATQPSANASLSDIQHVVILMQENRSFDHYFGTASGVRGFADRSAIKQRHGGRSYPIFDQFGYQPGHGPDVNGFLQPFELFSDPPKKDGETTNDITHDWGPQHYAWGSGRMNGWLPEHLAADGDANGFLTMGYFTRATLPFYYALADAFTICDGYFCSVLGPTYPNRLFWISASLGANGKDGGPLLYTPDAGEEYYAKLTWETMPERLFDAGVSWKVYQDPSNQSLLSPFPLFKVFAEPSTPAQVRMAAQAMTPTYPAEFTADVAAGTLPSVSWILPPLACCEHPAAPPAYGEWLVHQILNTLVSNPDVWASTVFLVVYDENGGWFDHVPPPTPGPLVTSRSAIPTAARYEGEYVTADPLPSGASYTIDGKTEDVYGPVGLGFRTPCLVISPFSRGGYVCSTTFDHTSTLRLLESRFGVEVPNLSGWRRSVTGDFTEALALFRSPDTSVPNLPATPIGNTKVAAQAVRNALLGTEDVGQDYPPPTRNRMPGQASSPHRKRLPPPGRA